MNIHELLYYYYFLLTLQTSLYVYQLVETCGASSSSGDGELERVNVLCSMDFDLSSFDVKKVGATFLYWFRKML